MPSSADPYTAPLHRDAPITEAFQWFLDREDGGIFAVTPDVMMADALAAPLLRVFSHQELWRWAHDQSQAVVGWQPLPFPDGRTSRLHWITTTATGTISGAVVGVGRSPASREEPTISSGVSDDLKEMLPGESDLAWSIRGQLMSLLRGVPSLRIRGAAGVGKDFLARRFIELSLSLGSLRYMDPLVLRGDQAFRDPVWLSRLSDAVDQMRPVLFHDLDRIPEHRVHRFLPSLLKARQAKVPVVATESLQVQGFAERMWSRAFRDAVELPVLNARREDIYDVARAIWKARLGQVEGPWMSPDVVRLLASADWSGNVAQLEEVLLDAHRRSGGNRIEPWALRLPTGAAAKLQGLGHAEYHAIVDELGRCEGNKSLAARLLGISRSTLYRKMRLHGIDTAG